jgi:hypothetical protein
MKNKVLLKDYLSKKIEVEPIEVFSININLRN